MAVIAPVVVAVDPRLQPEFIERMKIEIHAEVTREIGRRAGVMVPVGLRSDAVDSEVSSQGIVFTAENAPETRRDIRGRLSFSRRRGPRLTPRDVGDHVYPSMAAGGLFRNAVEKVILASGPLVTEYAHRAEVLG